ncbi:MAG: hypothetical protein ACQEXJ_12325 [Myxococcota bacterium]
MRSIALAFSLIVLLAAAPASAATLYVANSCYGQPSPCTTNLQSALDDSRYDIVEIVDNATFTGDFLVDRSVDLRGNTGAGISNPTGSDYCLRVESTSTVKVRDLTLEGRVAVYDSSDVSFYTVDVDGGTLGVQIVDSSDILLRTSTVDASLRAVDAVDTVGVDVIGGSYQGGRYALVGSDATFTTWMTSLDGGYQTVVLQDGHTRTIPDLDAEDTDFTTGSSGVHVYRWSYATTTYSSCTPRSPSEAVSSSGDLVDLIGYTPYGGG